MEWIPLAINENVWCILPKSLDQNGIRIHLVLKLQMPTFLVSIYLKHNVEEITVACNADL